MIGHAQDIIPLLLWMIVVVGASLLGLLVWIGKRLQRKVDELPDQVTVQVVKIHDEIVGQMAEMNKIHGQLERDVREQVTALDRRVTVLEVTLDLHRAGN